MIHKLLRGDEVAEILSISRSQAFSLMRRGEIRTIRFGRLVRVRIEDLEDFIEKNRLTPPNQGLLKNQSHRLPGEIGADVSKSLCQKEFTHE